MVRKMLRDGELGVLQEMRARGKEDSRAGGEDLIVLGTHTFDLLRYFAGDPLWVFSHISNRTSGDVKPEQEHEGTEPVGPLAGDQVSAMFNFPGNIHGYFGSKSNDLLTGERFGVTLYGSRAVAFVPLTAVPSSPPFVLRSSGWAGGTWERIEYPKNAQLITREDANAAMGADLLSAIETNREPVCSARDGCWTIEMVAAIYRSQYSGTRVSFPMKNRS
jgi:predicted dehydrogenase